MARGRIQNRRPIGAASVKLSRRSLAKTKPRRENVGGRPLTFIPELIVEAAARLYDRYRQWSQVLAILAGSGNGRWPRSTLIRRVRRGRIQKVGGYELELRDLVALERVAKTKVLNRPQEQEYFHG